MKLRNAFMILLLASGHSALAESPIELEYIEENENPDSVEMIEIQSGNEPGEDDDDKPLRSKSNGTIHYSRFNLIPTRTKKADSSGPKAFKSTIGLGVDYGVRNGYSHAVIADFELFGVIQKATKNTTFLSYDFTGGSHTYNQGEKTTTGIAATNIHFLYDFLPAKQKGFRPYGGVMGDYHLTLPKKGPEASLRQALIGVETGVQFTADSGTGFSVGGVAGMGGATAHLELNKDNLVIKRPVPENKGFGVTGTVSIGGKFGVRALLLAFPSSGEESTKAPNKIYDFTLIWNLPGKILLKAEYTRTYIDLSNPNGSWTQFKKPGESRTFETRTELLKANPIPLDFLSGTIRVGVVRLLSR
jgi:hypothetical protein